MGLLAGEKRKQKIGLDPNNLTWAKDTSSVGQSMLKKMGWKEGVGLGANEDGRVDPVKASMKCNTAGLGCSARQADAWIAHGEEFDQILASLNASSTKSEDGVGSPASGRNSPNDEVEGQRRFYGRFSRGGVKKMRTAEDLNCIFGRRKTAQSTSDGVKEETKAEESNESTEDKNESQDKNVDKSHGVETVTSSYSVQDYFAQKLKKLQQKKQDEGDSQAIEGTTEKQDTDSDTQNSDTQDRKDAERDFNSYVTSTCSVNDYFSQKMKAKRVKLAPEMNDCETSVNEKDDSGKENVLSENGFNDDVVIESDKESNSGDIKKKKKKKKRKNREAEISDTDPSLDTNNSGVVTSDENLEKKKKKKKDENVENCTDEVTANEDCNIDALHPSDEWENRKKRKQKRKAEDVENVEGSNPHNVNDGTDESCLDEKKGKRKNKKRKTDDDVCDDDDLICIEETTEKKKKKKNKKARDENVDSCFDQSNTDVSCTKEKAKKKKKKKKSER